jgi:hypothetical protein
MTSTISALRDLLDQRHARGIQLVPNDEGDLTVDAPQGVLTADLLEQLKAQKAALVAHLQPKRRHETHHGAPPPPSEARLPLRVDYMARRGHSRWAVNAAGLRRMRAICRPLPVVRRRCFTSWRVTR